MFAMEAMLGRPAVQLKMPRLDAYAPDIDTCVRLLHGHQSGKVAHDLWISVHCREGCAMAVLPSSQRQTRGVEFDRWSSHGVRL